MGQRKEGKDAGKSSGVSWPLDESGIKRSTIFTGKKIWAAAVKNESATLAEEILKEKKWRKVYEKIVSKVTLEQAKSREKALRIAHAGLEELYNQFTFRRNEEEILLREAMKTYTEPVFESYEIVGSASLNTENEKGIDFGVNVELLEKYATNRILEDDVVESFKTLMKNGRGYLDELRDTWFVLIGATSELCPLRRLLQLGLNVVAISRPSASRQAQVIEIAKSSPGRLIVPVRKGQNFEELNDDNICEFCGADVLVDTPEIRTWLMSMQVAMDSIVKELLEDRPDTALAYLVSPLTAYPIPMSCLEEIKTLDSKRSLRDSVLSKLFGPFKPQDVTIVAQKGPDTDEEIDLAVINLFFNYQGSSYALAKQIQNWRCHLARERSIVSANITPACKTNSVLRKGSIKRATKGQERLFKHLMIFEPEHCSDLMAGLLIYDVCCPDSPANPSVSLDNPTQLLESNGVHGGIWRFPYQQASIGAAAYIFGLF